jgi:hypothetical protein
MSDATPLFLYTGVTCERFQIYVFNKYFADISNIENEPNLPNEDFARANICPELLITEQEVKDQLEILNNSKQSHNIISQMSIL